MQSDRRETPRCCIQVHVHCVAIHFIDDPCWGLLRFASSFTFSSDCGCKFLIKQFFQEIRWQSEPNSPSSLWYVKWNCMSHSHTFQYITFNTFECQVGRCSVQLRRWFIGNQGSCQWGLLHLRSIKPWLGRDSTPTWVKPQWEENGGALWVVGELWRFAGTQLAGLHCFYAGFIRGRIEILPSHSSARLNEIYLIFPSAFYLNLCIRWDRESITAYLF